METETNLVFVCTRTGTIDGIDSSARVVDLDACGFVPDGDDWTDDVTIQNLAETSGVPVADLWAAYQREKLRAGDGFRYRHGWQHCDTATEYDDDGVTCRVCYRFMTWDQADERMAG